MKTFNILDRNLNIHQSYFLEASAGTGKTFSIENLVVRLLIEHLPNGEPPLSLNAILVVTFTRAATRELKGRIRMNMEKALSLLKSAPGEIPDYLQGILDQGGDKIKEACRCLERALAHFEEAQIFTIHGFCARMMSEFALESGTAMQFHWDEDSSSSSALNDLIKDFFRTHLNYSPGQLQIAAKKGLEALIEDISKIIKQERKVLAPVGYQDLYGRFEQAFNILCEKFNPTSEGILQEIDVIAKTYNKTCRRDGTIHEDKLLDAQNFVKLFEELSPKNFDRLLEGQLLHLLTPENRSKKAKPVEGLKYPGFFDEASRLLLPIIQEVSNRAGIIARMARDCIELRDNKPDESSIYSPDDILKKMHQHLPYPQFVSRIRNRYSAAIIDEFQDTDPRQWDIFSTCFLAREEQKFCYLVGDPKQSIYAFRRADIYTYLRASESFPSSSKASLTTNYRSQSGLIHTLNELYKGSWMPLPKASGRFLQISDVNAAPNRPARSFQDQKCSLHFFISEASESKKNASKEAEEALQFPFIAGEILSLQKSEGFLPSSFAVLIKDRYQGQRLLSYLKNLGIPACTKRNTALSESPVLDALEDILIAVYNPRDRSQVRKALGGKILGWTHEQVLSNAEEAIDYFYSLENSWRSGSFAHFYERLMHQRVLPEGKCPAETILERSDGESFYVELMQLAELLIEAEFAGSRPEFILEYLKELKTSDPGEEGSLKLIQDESTNAVQILTQHMSKGLEYDVVFALGLASRTSQAVDFVPDPNNDESLVLCKEGDDNHEKYCEELDAEKMRQLYVAMTRAKERLYVPAVIDSSLKKKGTASAIEIFFSWKTGQIESYTSLYQTINQLQINTVQNLLDHWSSKTDLSYSILTPQIVEKQEEKSSALTLQKPQPFCIPGKMKVIHSYTSLASRLTKSEVVFEHFQTTGTTPHTIPLGASTGTAVHAILQEIPLILVNSAPSFEKLVPYVFAFLKGSRLEKWTESIAEMIFNAFNVTFKTPEAAFSLKDVDPNKVMREMEFLFPSPPILCEDIKVEEGFLGGFIDLMFEYQEKYYFIDWKTNWLGPHQENYAERNLHEAMENNGYFLQAEIYEHALRRYFSLFDKRPFEECFGGCFYLFLRGVNRFDNRFGIFHSKRLQGFSPQRSLRTQIEVRCKG